MSPIRRLHRHRPRRPFVRGSATLMLVTVVAVWWGGGLWSAPTPGVARWENLRRFLTELRPYPLQGRDWDLGLAWEWWSERIGPVVVEASLSTLALAVVAVAAAAAGGWLVSVVAARPLGWKDPFLRPSRSRGMRVLTAVPRYATRGGLVLLRGIPVYVWAFLLLGIMGIGAWTAVVALAIHNAGILGRLFAEGIENLPPATAQRARAEGAARSALWVWTLRPQLEARSWIYVFYRFETCVRESTVLGLLGLNSLGWFIQDARAGQRLDEMWAFVLLGSGIIVASDLMSHEIRTRLRRSSQSQSSAASLP